jgi:hypothetical protein
MREARRNSPWNVVDLGLVAAKYKFILYPDMNPQPRFDDPIQVGLSRDVDIDLKLILRSIGR